VRQKSTAKERISVKKESKESIEATTCRPRLKNLRNLHGQSRRKASGWRVFYSNSHSPEYFVSPCIVTEGKEIKTMRAGSSQNVAHITYDLVSANILFPDFESKGLVSGHCCQGSSTFSFGA
jgi:hypothetical protein